MDFIKRSIKLIWRHTMMCYALYLFDSYVIFCSEKNSLKQKTLLLVRLDAIGDYVLFRNFIEVLRNSKKYKDYRITLCGNVLWKDIAENFDDQFVDEFIWIDRERIVKNLSYRKNVLEKIKRAGFEIAIQPTYSREFMLGDAIIRVSCAKERIGSDGDLSNITRFQKKVSDKYYTKLVSISPDCAFEFYKNKNFFSIFLNKSIILKCPAFNVDEIKINLDKCIVIMPGAGAKFRQWRCENFAGVANYVIKKYGIKKIFIAGGNQDVVLAKRISQLIDNKDVDIVITAGKQTLGEFVMLTAKSFLLLTNETGAAHISVATKTKTICISNGNHYGRFNPYPSEVSADIAYAYPEEIRKKQNDFKFLCKTYGRGSGLDLNTVQVDDVVLLVDKILQ